MSDVNWRTELEDIHLEDTHKAVRAYARTEFAGLTRKVIHRLQRIEASGIFGDD